MIIWRRGLAIACICMVAAALLASCSGAASGPVPSPSAAYPEGRPPASIRSYVAHVLEQYGRATSVEWVRLSSPPRKGHLQDVGLLAHGATPLTGVSGFLDFADGTRVRSLGWYVLAAQGRFAARVRAKDSPLPVSTVLIQLHAVSANGSPAVPETQVRTYEQPVHLDAEGTRAYKAQ